MGLYSTITLALQHNVLDHTTRAHMCTLRGTHVYTCVCLCVQHARCTNVHANTQHKAAGLTARREPHGLLQDNAK